MMKQPRHLAAKWRGCFIMEHVYLFNQLLKKLIYNEIMHPFYKER
jgi:hypothetical protein